MCKRSGETSIKRSIAIGKGLHCGGRKMHASDDLKVTLMYVKKVMSLLNDGGTEQSSTF